MENILHRVHTLSGNRLLQRPGTPNPSARFAAVLPAPSQTPQSSISGKRLLMALMATTLGMSPGFSTRAMAQEPPQQQVVPSEPPAVEGAGEITRPELSTKAEMRNASLDATAIQSVLQFKNIELSDALYEKVINNKPISQRIIKEIWLDYLHTTLMLKPEIELQAETERQVFKEENAKQSFQQQRLQILEAWDNLRGKEKTIAELALKQAGMRATDLLQMERDVRRQEAIPINEQERMIRIHKLSFADWSMASMTQIVGIDPLIRNWDQKTGEAQQAALAQIRHKIIHSAEAYQYAANSVERMKALNETSEVKRDNNRDIEQIEKNMQPEQLAYREQIKGKLVEAGILSAESFDALVKTGEGLVN